MVESSLHLRSNLSSLGTHSRIGSLPRAGAHAVFSVGRVRSELVGALRNRSFRVFILAALLSFTAIAMQSSLAVLMGTYLGQFTPAQLQSVLLGVYGGMVLGAPLWNYASRGLEKRTVFVVGAVGYGAFINVPILCRIVGFYPAFDSPMYVTTLGLSMLVAGFFAAGALVSGASMIADIADEHDLDTGLRAASAERPTSGS